MMNRLNIHPIERLLPPLRPLALGIVLVGWLVAMGCAEVMGKVPGHAVPETALLAAMSSTPAGHTVSEEPLLTPDEHADIEWLTSILENPANEAHTRSGAALRLMGIGHPRAIEPLVAALEGEDDELKSAVALAIQEVTSPPPQLLEPAIRGLRTAGGTTLDQLSLALTRYGAKAHERLVATAQDRASGPAERLGAIAALGTFRTHEATDALVQLLDPGREEPEAIIDAATDALQRATGLPYGNNAAQWRSWWADAGDQPSEQWLTNLVQRLSEQLTQAEQKIEREREATARVQQRLAQAYRDLFPRLELDEQLRALPGLLDDPMPVLRDFAVDRVARLLRDSVRIPEEVQDKLADRLSDDVPALRLQTVRLLEQMNYDQLAARLGERLLEEQNDESIEGFLDILAKRPGAIAFPAVVPLLDSERHGERAAIALWEIVNHETIDPEELASLFERSRDNKLMLQSPEHARLLARIAPEDKREPIVALMDGDDVELKLAVAKGLMRRGAVSPLLDRISDEAIYPFAARAIARAESPWSGFRQLIVLRPPEAHETVWREQIQLLAGRLPAERIIEADELLASANGVPSDLRIRFIQRRLNSNDNENNPPVEMRAQLTLRLAELFLQTDQPELALERLESSAEVAASSEAATLHFRALLRTEQYDRAQQIVPEPDEWIVLLERWADRQSDQAVALREEIERRFNGQLNEELQEQLERVTERLPSNPPDASPSEVDPADGMGEA